ncbi:MAG: stage III sporulation protein AC [Sarcina sp.]
MDFEIIFKLAGIGILLVVIDKLLSTSKREDISSIINIAGIVGILIMVITLIKQLFDSIRTMFMM